MFESFIILCLGKNVIGHSDKQVADPTEYNGTELVI
jgi:hypothetical protein